MNKDEILNMPAGQDMDLLVAEQVLKLDSVGWNERFFHNHAKFSTDIRAAWEVVERVRASLNPCKFYLIEDPKKGENVRAVFDAIMEDAEYEAKADTAPLAICRAALLASVGAE